MNKICISEPDSNCNARTPLTPETLDRTPVDERVNKNQLTPTITEENEHDDHSSISHKSSLSLPVEPPLGPEEKSRRKLSVQGLMAFAERRRSSSTFSDIRKMSISNGDSIHLRSPGGTGMSNCPFTPFVMINMQTMRFPLYKKFTIYLLATPGGMPSRNRPSSKMTKYVECWGADKPFANITDSKMAKNIGLAVRHPFEYCLFIYFIQTN